MGADRRPRVSVCVPMYNGAHFLRPCIDSILGQTCGDFEVLLVDDCSSDDTVALAQQYADTDPRIRLSVNAKNLGLVGNWNRCIELARGEWIKFVFQDDAIHSQCLERMLHVGGTDRAFVACRRTVLFDEGTTPNIRAAYDEHRRLTDELFRRGDFLPPAAFQRWALEHFGVNPLGEPTCVMIHRRVFERFGLFDPALIMCCDFEMWLRIGIHLGAAVIADELATFRVHKGSTTAENIGARQFRTEILDGIVLLHHYAYDPAYEPVRQAARRQSPLINLRREFTRRCHEAQAMADWWIDADARGRTRKSEWLDVARLYPAIEPTRLLHFFWKVRRRLEPSLIDELPETAREFLK